MNAATKARGRAGAQKRLEVEVRQQLLDGIYAGKPFRRIVPDHGLSFSLRRPPKPCGAGIHAAEPDRRGDEWQRHYPQWLMSDPEAAEHEQR
jgi:hypothetical protein